MIRRFIDLQEAIESFLDDWMQDKYGNHDPTSENVPGDTIFKFRLRRYEYAILNEICGILAPLKEYTKALERRPSEKDDLPVIYEVLPTFRYILGDLERLSEVYRAAEDHSEVYKDHPAWAAITEAVADTPSYEVHPLRAAIQKGWEKADEFYRKLDETPIYAAALLLDPNWKKQVLVREQYDEAWQAHTLKAVRQYYRIYYQYLPIPIVDEPFSQDPSPNTAPQVSLVKQRLEQLRQRPAPATPICPPSDELEHFLNAPTPCQYISPNKYWRQDDVRQLYPRLHRMALDIYAVPAMSAEPERIFSAGGLLMSSRRRRLAEETSEAALCLRSWINEGIVKIHLEAPLSGLSIVDLDN